MSGSIFADNNVPQVISTFCARITDKGIGPLDVTGLLRGLLISFFSNPDNFKYESLKERVYREGEDTGITIESVGKFTPELASKRPAIFIRRGDWQTHHLGISSSKIFDEYQNYPALASYVHTCIGTHNIIVIGKTYAETEMIAEEVYRFLLGLQPFLANTAPFVSFRVRGLSEPKALKEGRDSFFVTIPLAYTISDKFTITYRRSE